MKSFGISSLTGRIYYGTSKNIGGNRYCFTGSKEDVTDEVIAVVFQWFEQNVQGKDEFNLTYPESEYELAMWKKKGTDTVVKNLACPESDYELVLRKKKEDKLEMKAESKFNEECAADCLCHKTVTHNACLFCNACRQSPYLKDELAGKSDDEIEKMRKEVESEA